MTSTSATTVTPVDELQLAVQRLRCDHAFPIQPPHGSLAKPGDCRHCGVTYAASSPVADHLREPLAAWLDNAAWWANQPPGGNRYAVAAARAVNGRMA